MTEEELKKRIVELKGRRSKLFREKHASPQILIDKTAKISEEINKLETELSQRVC